MLEIVLPVCGTLVITIVSVTLSYYYSKKAQINFDWQQKKIEHYKNLLSALSDLAISGVDNKKALNIFSSAVNTIALVASQDVVNALMEFIDEIKRNNPNGTFETQNELLKKLLLAMRKDLGIKPKDDPDKFDFHLIRSA